MAALYLVDLEKSNKQFDLFLCDAIDDLAIVANQLRDHLGHVQSDVALKYIKKFELMLTRRAKAVPLRKLSVCLLPFRRSSFLDFVLQQKIAKINNKQHVCTYLQSFSRYTR